MKIPLPSAHLLTCPGREASLALTLASWEKTGWPAPPHIHTDSTPPSARAQWGATARAANITAAYITMLREILSTPGSHADWLLLLEDDLAFHPALVQRLAAWPILADEDCAFASLFNPSLIPLDHPAPLENAFAASPRTFLGNQAILIRRANAARALAAWDTTPGMQAQRLAKILCTPQNPIWVHRPSLVQHIATDSAWGARIQVALDFHPER